MQQGQTGMAKLPDPRLDRLSGMFKPKKTTPAEIAFLDTPGLDTAERRDNPRRLGVLRESNGLVVVLNGYSGGDLAKELRRFREEIAFADLEIVTNRVSKIEANLRKPRPAKEKEIDLHEQAVLQRLIAALESGQPPAQIGLKPDEELAIRSFQLLTLKPEIVLVNQGDALVGQPLPDNVAGARTKCVGAPARLEVRTRSDAVAGRSGDVCGRLGHHRFEPGRDAAGHLCGDEPTRVLHGGGGRMPCLAVAERSRRRRGRRLDPHRLCQAVCTGRSRGLRGFLASGGMKEAKALGVYRLEGKTYIVQDGDIMHILASS